MSRDIAAERVTGIEPAQSAWKAWDSCRHLCWSPSSLMHAVPSACLSAEDPSEQRLFGVARSAVSRVLRFATTVLPPRALRSDP
ncbi:protein of unknown function [Blastococcus saxobsidens DD2]|uniref:Uncharacterized protein n=1 Tax=Blastococcus saxobsidens (strain DD2) TaxID=1146883 RepID=H6RKG1_BLASD|nr:protein of unknown function [Blastococcus saxobsidens DD2]